ncbi:MAG: hypothetical protein H8E25_11820 [Planctomycetes bacterium]|nr:hypothetical protein [Planctomycetota bacterium]
MRVYPIPSLAFFCLSLFLTGCQEQGAAAIEPLSVSPQRLQFDRIQFGQKSTGTWVLSNHTDSDVVISRIGPFSCQCISAKLRLPARDNQLQILRGDVINLALRPDETAEIIFTLDTARYRKPVSRKLGSIPIVFADYPGMILEWSADIYTPFVVSPWAIELGDIGIRQRKTGRAVVAAHDSNDFSLDINGVYHGWHVKSNPVAIEGFSRAAFELIFTAPDELPEGPFSQLFKFNTNLVDAPPVKINVQGNVQLDVYAQPQRLLFDPSRENTTQKFAIVQRAAGHKAPILDHRNFSEQGFELEYLDHSTDDVSFYKLSYTGAAPSAGANGVFTISTDYQLQPTLDLSYTILPKR